MFLCSFYDLCDRQLAFSRCSCCRSCFSCLQVVVAVDRPGADEHRHQEARGGRAPVSLANKHIKLVLQQSTRSIRKRLGCQWQCTLSPKARPAGLPIGGTVSHRLLQTACSAGGTLLVHDDFALGVRSTSRPSKGLGWAIDQNPKAKSVCVSNPLSKLATTKIALLLVFVRRVQRPLRTARVLLSTPLLTPALS